MAVRRAIQVHSGMAKPSAGGLFQASKAAAVMRELTRRNRLSGW
jgi:hypothetical protein